MSVPGGLNPLLLKSAAAEGAYQISRSVRFNSSDSAYLSRTPASAGNRKTWTWAGWVKRSGLSSNNYLFTTTFTNAAAAGFLYFNSTSNTLTYWDRRSSADGAILITNAVFRDASAWYHVVLSVDYSNATPANRAKLYVNGVEQTYSITSYPATSEDSYFNAATAHYISSTGGFIDGYLADVHLVDGQALTPSDFTETDATTGQLIPKAYSGTYGTNGFHLPFSDNSTAAALGTDTSGNGNTWTVNNIVADSLYSNAGFVNPQNAFDGNTATSAEVNVSAALGTFIFTTGISVSSSVTVKYASGTSGNIFLNGSATAMQGTGTQTQTISFSGTLNSLGLQSGSQPLLYYVQIDGGSYLTGANAVDNDSLVDTPSSTGVDAGNGGEVGGNYCTWNPLKGTTTFANGNLEASTTTGGSEATVGTVGMQSGKWYWEVTLTVSGTSAATIGIATNSFNATNYVGNDAGSWGYYSLDGNKYTNGSGSSYGTSYGNGDVIGVAFDADNGNLYFYKNGTVQNSGTAAYTSLTSGPYFPAVGDATSGGAFTFTLNAGQRPFAYTAPSGYKALCTTNLPAPVVAQPSTVMDVKLYTGNGGTQSISGLGFNPDLIWTKARSNASNHLLVDVIRGGNKVLLSDVTDSEYTGNYIQSFDSSGFTINSTSSGMNQSGYTYVAWTWDAGTSTVTNSQGSITSQVRANASSGFSICTFSITSASSSIVTFGHGLGVAPSLVILKVRTVADDWTVYHGGISSPTSNWLTLDSTAAAGGATSTFSTSSTTFGVRGTRLLASGTSGDIVAYCFSPVAGYSSFGSYTGNGSADGPFVYTGFRPKWFLVKRTDSTNAWVLFDSVRGTFNLNTPHLQPHLSDAEANVSTYGIDFLSNGVKPRATDTSLNSSGGTYIYAAFAESPFQYARAR